MTNPIRPTKKSELIPLIFLFLVAASSIYFFKNFPQSVPIHWNADGEADNYGTPLFAAFFLPAIIIGVYLMMLFMPIIDPRKKRYEEFRKTYHIFKNVIIVFFVMLYWLSSFAALGFNINITLWVTVFIGLLFGTMGNYMSKLKRNWFIGIRTPWTLSSEEVWNKTHRAAGKAFIFLGFIFLGINFVPPAHRLLLAIPSTLIIIIGVIFYSNIIYSKKKK